MRVIRATAVVTASIALGLLATSASAAETLWSLLPGTTGTTFTGKSGKVTFQIKGSGSFISSSSEASGEITAEKTLGLEVDTYVKSTLGGLPVNSLGDAAGVVLVHYELHHCLIGGGPLAGWLRKMLPLHLEVPSTKLLLTMEGSQIAQLTPNKTKSKTFNLIVEQKEGKASIEKCEGGTALTLLTSLDGGAFVQSAQEAKEASVTFTTEQETMA